MDQNLDTELEKEKPDLKKFRQAGYGFLGLSVIYLTIAMVFIPPFNPGESTIVYIASFLAVAVVLTVFICRGKKLLTQILAVIYGARSAFSIFALAGGDTFAAVPYFLPCLLLTFYLLGRAAWDWP